MIFFDTCIIIYIYAGEPNFSAKALDLIDNNDCVFSPMVRLELAYLYEIGRIKKKPEKILNSLYQSIGLTVDKKDFDAIILESMKETWTRDPFDRIITAHARILDSYLLSTDSKILANYSKCIR